MKKLLILFLSIPFIFSLSLEKDVYICKGPKAKKYHYNKNCRGLKNCSTAVYKISLGQAKK